MRLCKVTTMPLPQILLVLDDGSQPLPLYVGRQAFPWDRDALASWDSGPLRPENGAWHSVSVCLNRESSLLVFTLDTAFQHLSAAQSDYQRVACHAGYPAGVRRALVSSPLPLAAVQKAKQSWSAKCFCTTPQSCTAGQ